MSATSIEASGGAAVTIADGTAATAMAAAYDVGFQQRLCGIATLVAIAVLNETGGTTARTNYAKFLLTEPYQVSYQTLRFAVPMDGVTGVSSTDQAIANRLGDLWTSLSVGS